MTTPPKIFAFDTFKAVDMGHHQTSATNGEFSHSLLDDTGTNASTLLITGATAQYQTLREAHLLSRFPG